LHFCEGLPSLTVIQVWGEAYQTTSVSDFLGFFLSQGVHEAVRLPSLQFPASLAPPFGLPPAQDNPMFYVAIYALIGLGVNFSNSTLVGVHFYGAFRSVSRPRIIFVSDFPCFSRASRRLFRALLKRLVYSTFRWFDSTPKGSPYMMSPSQV
jgi:hypothetical protein